MTSHHPQHPASPAGLHIHHGPHAAHPQVNGHLQAQAQPKITPAHLSALNENVWLLMGSTYELQGNSEQALYAYEQALRHNYQSVQALNAISNILRVKEDFPRAVDYLQTMLKIDQTNGEVWGSLGHCFLMMEDLQQAYQAYQQALYHLRDPKEPKLWYGIGILYDRYGSLEHAEEAFSQVMQMQPNFDKANEIYFRLGIIYKQQQKYDQSLECFKYIVSNPPRPLTEEDIWFQIGHVHEQQKDYDSAKGAYQKVLQRDPHHAKVLQQLGWLHHQESPHYHSQEQAIEYLEKSVSSDNGDAQSWYLLGRCYMSQQKYPKAYEAYQQAVYRDGRNPTFWCSIGVLYYQINQYRDALDAYSRAIRLNPYISEVWYDLGTLYESCNNQTADALDAYQRAFDLDPSNNHIKARLSLLRNGGQSTGMTNQGAAPEPQDVHPQQYQAPGVNGPPTAQWGLPGGVNPAAHGGIPPQQAPSAPVQDWNHHLADIQQPQPQQPQPANPYDQRDPARTAPIQRQLSPRQEPLRQYQDQPSRYQPARHSPPPPALNRAPPNAFPPAPQALPQPQASVPQANGPSHAMNGSLDPAMRYAPGASQTAPAPGAAPYGRGNSPPPEIKPIAEGRQSSPAPNYPAQHYQHHPNTSQSVGIAAGAPPPAAALAAAEAAARDRDEAPILAGRSGFKRTFESDDDHYMGAPRKHVANGETRSRLEDLSHRRPSPPDRKPSPARGMRSPPVERRASPPKDHARSGSHARLEEKRKAEETYHPSEAAHNPPALPSIQAQGPPPHPSQTALPAPPGPPQPPAAEPVRDDRKETYEAAARKMDVDEDYDDEPPEDKRKEMSGGHNSPRATAVAGPANTEIEAN